MQRALGLATLAAVASAGPPGNKRKSFAIRLFNLPYRCFSAVLVQLFQWSWDNIAKVNPTVYYAQMLYSSMIIQECTQFLGPAGYGFVQSMMPHNIQYLAFTCPVASPPQEHITGDAWFVDYQVGKQ